MGVRGIVRDKATKDPIGMAICRVDARNSTRDAHWWHSDRVTGDHFRPLLPGHYTIECGKEGYKAERVDVIVPDGQREQVVVNVDLLKIKSL